MLNNLKQSLPLLAGALAGKQGVKVLQGDWAKSNCIDTIWLPPLPESDPNVLAKALGFVGHETAHISFTDTSLGPEINQQKNRDTFFGIMNLLEDIRIETLQKRRFPGVAKHLDNLVKVLVGDGTFHTPKEGAHPNKIMHDWMLLKLRFEVLNQDALEAVLTETEELFVKTLPKNTQIRLEALAFDVKNAESTRDVFNITSAIMKMLQEEAEKEQKEEEEQAKQDQAQQSNSNQPANSGQSQSGDTSDGQDDGTGTADDSGDGDGDSGDGDGSGDADDASAQADGGNGDSAGDAGPPKMSDVLKKILGAGPADQYQDIGDVLAKDINDIKVASQANAPDGGGPLRVFNAEKQSSKGRNNDYDFKARRAVNALKQKLHTTLQAQTMTSFTRSNTGSRFSTRHLHQIKTGGSVFQKRTEGIDIDLVAALLTDISPSMREGGKLEIAALASYATAEAIASVHGASAAVAVFPTASGIDYINPYGVKPVLNAENFATLSAQGSTPLSDSMARVAIDLLQQPQARKLLMVLTDGDPNHNDQSQMVIKSAENAGIEVMGIGIGVTLDHLFDVWCTIDSIEDLPKAMFGLLQNRLSYKQAA